MTEEEHTIKLANILLDQPGMDPDDDLRTLSRQFLRKLERCNAAEERNVSLAEKLGLERARANEAEAQLSAATKRADENDERANTYAARADELGQQLFAERQQAEAAEGALREIEAIELPAAAEVGHVTEALALVARCRVIARHARALTGEGAER